MLAGESMCTRKMCPILLEQWKLVDVRATEELLLKIMALCLQCNKFQMAITEEYNRQGHTYNLNGTSTYKKKVDVF